MSDFFFFWKSEKQVTSEPYKNIFLRSESGTDNKNPRLKYKRLPEIFFSSNIITARKTNVEDLGPVPQQIFLVKLSPYNGTVPNQKAL
jgi:hypothetical protein